MDPEIVLRLLDRLADELRNLRRLASYSDELLQADPERLMGTKFRFVVALETCIDIAEHILSAHGLTAETFADTFAVLGQIGVLDASAVPTLQAMARFRNLLVHGYAQTDDQRVIVILRTCLDDLDGFKRQIARAVLLETEPDTP
jgi:uncharacterized protein YutE (UPF0331/DUF86 family)